MDFFNGINEILKTLATNKGSRVWFALMLLIGIAWVSREYFFPDKPKVINECDYLMEQNKQLVNALLFVKQNIDSLSEGKPISYIQQESYFMFASYQDTVKKKLTAKDYQKQTAQVSKQIDSILMQNKKYLDSAKKKSTIKQKSL